MGSVLNSEAVVGAQGRKPSRMRASRAGGPRVPEGRPALGPESGQGSEPGDVAGPVALGAWHKVEVGALGRSPP